MPTQEDIDKACNYFSCSSTGRSTQDMLFYQGVLLCALNQPTNTEEYVVSSQVLSEADDLAAGAKSHTFLFSDDFEGTINGTAFSGPRDQFVLTAPGSGTLGEIPITISAGELTIFTLTPP